MNKSTRLTKPHERIYATRDSSSCTAKSSIIISIAKMKSQHQKEQTNEDTFILDRDQ